MFNHQYVPIKQIVDKVKRGKLYKELPYESAIDYSVEAYRLIASEKAEVKRPFKILIEDYRGTLPPDLERVITVVKTDECLKSLSRMRYGTHNLQTAFHVLNSPDLKCISDYTYTLNNKHIHTNFESGYLFMIYTALPTDENCELLIPDNVNVQLAIEYYIKSRFLDDLGSDDAKIERQQQKDEQNYCWYIGKAQAHMTNLSMDEYESFANSVSKLFDTDDYSRTFLDTLGAPEYVRNQRYG